MGSPAERPAGASQGECRPGRILEFRAYETGRGCAAPAAVVHTSGDPAGEEYEPEHRPRSDAEVAPVEAARPGDLGHLTGREATAECRGDLACAAVAQVVHRRTADLERLELGRGRPIAGTRGAAEGPVPHSGESRVLAQLVHPLPADLECLQLRGEGPAACASGTAVTTTISAATIPRDVTRRFTSAPFDLGRSIAAFAHKSQTG